MGATEGQGLGCRVRDTGVGERMNRNHGSMGNFTLLYQFPNCQRNSKSYRTPNHKSNPNRYHVWVWNVSLRRQ